jgi:hypothetical protein
MLAVRTVRGASLVFAMSAFGVAASSNEPDDCGDAGHTH